MTGVITDPAFWWVALPAVLLLGLSKSGFASGMGSLATPLLAVAMPVPQAAAVMLPLLAVADAMALWSLRRSLDRAVLRQLLPAGLAGIVIGWLSFGLLPGHVVAGIVGVITLLFLAQQLVWPPRADAPLPGHGQTATLALLSGYTSFVAHGGGPPIAMALLPRRMEPLAYAGTSAVFFATINLAKWVPYALLGLFDARNLATSAVLVPVAAGGVILGVWATRRVSTRWFYRLVQLGMLLTGLKLLMDGIWPHG
ncbi:sulfite exporter TauE/SafE family protein [Sphaerotilus mobilis]|uniref:Probable membrane transporter protein n=1 Tax=Sphaerotilus mobilis TaxID=47994 RepID=A0A4Q7LUN4_9BURK|nr:sulfite exporter TauE/SafE family protein [Sphaerotilus mobilis]RZS58103.1 hypothetical protein EV685_0382 [Sphaerotilus mobilis]